MENRTARPAQSEYRRLTDALRVILKERRVTYRQLALELGLAEVSIKRLFTKQDGPVGRISDICDVLGLSFHDLVNRAHRAQGPVQYLSQEQDTFFASHLPHYDFFCELVWRRTVDEIRAKHGLSAPSAQRYLLDLDRIGVIECRPGDRIKLLLDEPVGMRKNSLLRLKITQRRLQQALDGVSEKSTKPLQQYLIRDWVATGETIGEFTADVKDVLNKFDPITAYEGRALPAGRLQSVDLLVAVIERTVEGWRIPDL